VAPIIGRLIICQEVSKGKDVGLCFKVEAGRALFPCKRHSGIFSKGKRGINEIFEYKPLDPRRRGEISRVFILLARIFE
jgi:hypothetical protein